MTGVSPFRGDSAFEVLGKHVLGERVPPSRAAPHLTIPASVDAIILRTLAAKPSDRFASTDELAQAICAVLGTRRPGASGTAFSTPATAGLLQSNVASGEPRSGPAPIMGQGSTAETVAPRAIAVRAVTLLATIAAFVVTTRLVMPADVSPETAAGAPPVSAVASALVARPAPEPHEPKSPAPQQPHEDPRPAAAPAGEGPKNTDLETPPPGGPALDEARRALAGPDPPVAEVPTEAKPAPLQPASGPQAPPPAPETRPPPSRPRPEPGFPYTAARSEIAQQLKYLRTTCMMQDGKPISTVKFRVDVAPSGTPNVRVYSGVPELRACFRKALAFPFGKSPARGRVRVHADAVERRIRPRAAREGGSAMSSAKLAAAGLHRQALLACVLLGLLGASVGAYLTVQKFRMAYTPCLGPRGGCQIGEMRCEDALGSAWSIVGGLPISAWASAAYVCITVLALGQLVRRGFLAGCAAPLLWALSLVVAFVSLAYAVYAFAILQSPCPFCLSLYVVALLLLAFAAVVRRVADPREQSGLRVAVRHRRASLIDAGFRLGMLLTIAVGVQSIAYHAARHTVTVRDGCPEQAVSLPAAPIRIGPDDAPVILAVYLDMSCSACKRKFKQLTNALRNKQFPKPVQMWIYHAPRHACDPAAFPAGFSRSDDRARDDNACLAARAAECMEKLQPGGGFRLIGGLFALHDDRQAGQPLFTAERVGNRAVDLGMEIDPDDRDNPLFRGIDDDRGVLATITAHQRHAEEQNVQVPTIAVHAAANGAIDPGREAYWIFANTPFDDLGMYIELQAAPPAPAR